MKERNRHTLQAALQALRRYQAPANGWERLARRLEEAPPEAGREPLHDALRTMPRYQAPDTVWQQLDARLPDPRSRWHWLPVSVAAAVLLSLSLLSWYQWQSQPQAPPAPQAEQKSSPAPDVAELALFDPASARLAECLSVAPAATQASARPELAALQALAQRRDSLQAAGDQPAAAQAASQHRARYEALMVRYCPPQ